MRSLLEKLLRSRLRAKVLGWMMLHRDVRSYARRLAGLLQEDPKNISVELARLAALGILTVHAEGRQKYYQADPACPILEDLREIVLKTSGLGDVLRHALDPFKEKIELAFVYGSFADGKEKTSSDLDIFILGEAGSREIAEALSPAARGLRREINPVVMRPEEFRKKIKARNHFMDYLMKAKKLYLAGNEHDLKELAG
ncbi:MAG: nucleotidyltransferase domain-containing protein [Candidatus Omnitrophota bacterium]